MLKFILLFILFSTVSSTKKLLDIKECKQNCGVGYKEVSFKLNHYKDDPSKFKYIFILDKKKEELELIVSNEICEFYCNNLKQIAFMRDEKYYYIRNIDFEDEDEDEDERCVTLTLNSVIRSGDCFNYILNTTTKTSQSSSSITTTSQSSSSITTTSQSSSSITTTSQTSTITSQINTTNDHNNNQGITIIIFATAIVIVLLFGIAIYNKIHKPVVNVKYPGSFIYNLNQNRDTDTYNRDYLVPINQSHYSTIDDDPMLYTDNTTEDLYDIIIKSNENLNQNQIPMYEAAT